MEGMPLTLHDGMHRGLEVRRTHCGTEEKSHLCYQHAGGNNPVSLFKKVSVLKCLGQPFRRAIRLLGGVCWRLLVKLGVVCPVTLTSPSGKSGLCPRTCAQMCLVALLLLQKVWGYCGCRQLRECLGK